MAESEGFGYFGRIARPRVTSPRSLPAGGLFLPLVGALSLQISLRLSILLRHDCCEAPPEFFSVKGEAEWRVAVDEKRTLQPLEIPLLIKIHRKRSMGWLIALDEPIFNKPTKPKEPINLEPYYDYVI